MKVLYTIALLFIYFFTYGQFTIPNGSVVGRQTVVPIPVNPPGYPTVQALCWFPDDYTANSTKRYPLYVFLGGAGKNTSMDITELTTESLPQLIAQGLNPYGIDPNNGDTIKFLVISPHCAQCGGSYSFPQLQYTLPYLYANYRVDTSCVFFGGLSSGGSCTWSMAMGNGASGNSSASPNDTLITKRITGIMPMANGGYDNNLTQSKLKANLDTTAKRGLACLYVIGDQDPGYNGPGFFAYQAEMKAYSKPNRYYDSVRIGGTHSANVWNIPFPLTARVWSTTMNSWTQMWTLRKNAAPIVLTSDAGSDQTITLPTTTVSLAGVGYTPGGTTITAYAWVKVIGTGGTITSPSSASTTVTGLSQGVYKYKLTVTNSASNQAVDTIMITVNAAAPTPPDANAGSFQNVTLPTTTATLTGSATPVSPNTITSVLWTQNSGPNTASITSPAATTTGVTGLIQGTYIMQLKCTDNLGQTDSATTSIIVSPSTPGGKTVKYVGMTEYKSAYLYSDSTVWTFYYNSISGHVEFSPYAIGRKIIGISQLFNNFSLLDDQHYLWKTDGKIGGTRIDFDTLGNPMNNVLSTYGYFYTGACIRSDSAIWYYGGDDYKFYKGTFINKPIKIHQPPGVHFKKLIMGKNLIGITGDGKAYQWFAGDTTATYSLVTLPGPVIDGGASQYNFVILVVDDGAGSNMGWPYAFGAECSFWGGLAAAGVNNPIALKTIWGMTNPMKKISVTNNIITYIDSTGELFSIGDGVNGERGNGTDTVIQYQYPTKYAWNWGKGNNYTGAPATNISNGQKWKDLFGDGGAFVFFHFGKTINDSLWFWGRNKSFAGGDGAANADEGNNPNALDVLRPSQRTPAGVPSNQIVYYTLVKGTLTGGIGQNTSQSQASLSANFTPTTLSASGFPNYGYSVDNSGWQWTQTGGPTAATIVSPNAQATNVNGMTQIGTYTFKVVGKDTQGASYSGTTTVTVTQNPYPRNYLKIHTVRFVLKLH